VGPPEYDVDYTVAGKTLGAVAGERIATVPALPETPFLNYEAGLRFELDPDSAQLATIQEPYFSRTYGHYCGHQNTPNRPEPVGPAAWQKGRIVMLAHPIDRLYYVNGAKVHRDYFAAALRLVHRSPMIEAALPSAGRVSLLHQPERKRYVAHLLYGPPIERGRCVVIEDLPELQNVNVRFRVPEEVRMLRLVPDDLELPIREIASLGADGNRTVETTVPRFSCHAGIVAEY
jgi:hypothetical protein